MHIAPNIQRTAELISRLITIQYPLVSVKLPNMKIEYNIHYVMIKLL